MSVFISLVLRPTVFVPEAFWSSGVWRTTLPLGSTMSVTVFTKKFQFENCKKLTLGKTSKFELIYFFSLTSYRTGPRGYLIKLDEGNNFANRLNRVRHWLHPQISNLKLKNKKYRKKVEV